MKQPEAFDHFDQLEFKLTKGEKGRRLSYYISRILGVTLVLMLLLPPYIRPVEGVVTSGFFLRQKPEGESFLQWEMHSGVDVAAPSGKPVRAAAWGRVVFAGKSPGYGNHVILRHPLGLESLYAHLSRIDTKEGYWVWQGKRVGLVGSTGRSTGPHLHYEIRFWGRPIPPGLVEWPQRLRRIILKPE